MADSTPELDQARAEYSRAYALRPIDKPRCTCGCAKRTHRIGWYECRKHRTTCTRYDRDPANKARHEADTARWRERIEPLRQRYTDIRDAHERAQRADIKQQYAQQRDAAAVAAGQRLPHDQRAVDVFKFSSLKALCDDAQREPVNPENRAQWLAFVRGGGLIFNHSAWSTIVEAGRGRNLAELCDWLARGWPEGVTQMREAIGKLTLPKLHDVRRRGRWADQGDTLSLDRLYSGNIDRCWRTTHRAQCGAPPRLQIIVQGALGGDSAAQALFWRGAPAAALAEAATAAGYQVAIDTVRAVTRYTVGDATYIGVVRVKGYDAPLNLATIMAAVATREVHMGVTWAHRARAALDKGRFPGAAYQPSENELRERGVIDRNSVALIVPMLTLSEYEARQWLDGAVKRLEALATGAA